MAGEKRQSGMDAIGVATTAFHFQLSYLCFVEYAYIASSWSSYGGLKQPQLAELFFPFRTDAKSLHAEDRETADLRYPESCIRV